MVSDQTQADRREAILTATAAAVSAVVVAKFADAQLDLLRRFAGLIARYGLGDLLLFSMRKAAKSTVGRLRSEFPPLVDKVIGQASADGIREAGNSANSNAHNASDSGRDMSHNSSGSGGIVTGHLTGGDSWESHAERSARAIREDLQGKLNLLGYRITRYADDVYRAVQADASQAQVLGLTPAQAQHEAYRKLVREGVTGFVDSKGRNWELSAYVEMATRTAAERAFNVSHQDRLQSLGFELFSVPDDGHPCPLCLPWQGKVLSVAPDSRADATITEATAAGLFHPNCRHALIGFLPGVTVLPEPHVWSDDDQQRYVESQRQRKLERDIRAAKREEAAAFTPEMRSQAQFAVRRAQARMREFIEQTGRVRNRRREQLNLGANA